MVLVTRKLPEAIEDRLRRDYKARLNPDDRLYSADEIVALAAGADAIFPCHIEKFTADVIARLPASVRAIANFPVGYDHVDIAAAKARGLIVTNTPDVLGDATAEIAISLLIGAARRTSEGERLVRTRAWQDLEPELRGRRPGHRQAPRLPRPPNAVRPKMTASLTSQSALPAPSGSTSGRARSRR